MAIVSFEKIAPITSDQVDPINGTGALGPTHDIEGRPTLYDPSWGYFVFGQSLSCEYNDAHAYRDTATFTIVGAFTPDAEGVSDLTDEEAFMALVAKYEALELIFENAAKAADPEDYAAWGTADDPRCIELPPPLVDKLGGKVRGLPMSLSIEKTQFPVEIKYRATLREAKFPAAKLLVNGFIVDNGTISFVAARPNFSRHELPGCSGEVLQLRHYYPVEASITGTLPLKEEGILVSELVKELTASLASSSVTLSLAVQATSGVETATIAEGFAIVDSPGLEADYAAGVMALSIQARE